MTQKFIAKRVSQESQEEMPRTQESNAGDGQHRRAHRSRRAVTDRSLNLPDSISSFVR